MTEILSIILLIFGVLQIILFFKLWGMTNDVRSMRAMVKDILSTDVKEDREPNHGIIQEGSLVVRLKDEVKMRVVRKDGYTYVCRPLGGGDSASYGRDEIELYSVFYKK